MEAYKLGESKTKTKIPKELISQIKKIVRDALMEYADIYEESTFIDEIGKIEDETKLAVFANFLKKRLGIKKLKVK